MLGPMLNTLAADLARIHRRPVPGSRLGRAKLVAASALKVRGLAVVLYRLSHAAGRKSAAAGALLKQLNHVLTGADIAHEATFGPGLCLWHPTGVVVAPGVVAGDRCSLHSCVTLGSTPAGSPELGDDVIVGPGARLYGAITVAENIQIGANAVVGKSFTEPGVVLAGVPAEVLRIRHNEERDTVLASIGLA